MQHGHGASCTANSFTQKRAKSFLLRIPCNCFHDIEKTDGSLNGFELESAGSPHGADDDDWLDPFSFCPYLAPQLQLHHGAHAAADVALPHDRETRLPVRQGPSSALPVATARVLRPEEQARGPTERCNTDMDGQASASATLELAFAGRRSITLLELGLAKARRDCVHAATALPLQGRHRRARPRRERGRLSTRGHPHLSHPHTHQKRPTTRLPSTCTRGRSSWRRRPSNTYKRYSRLPRRPSTPFFTGPSSSFSATTPTKE